MAQQYRGAVVVVVVECFIGSTLITTLAAVSKHKPTFTSPAAKRNPESRLGRSKTITLPRVCAIEMYES